MANPKSSENESAPAGASNDAPPEPVPPPTAPVVIQNADGMLCRPPPGVGLHTLGHVVIGNWFGHVDGKPVTVEHGTPVRGLPPAVAKKIRETPEQRVGPFDSRKKTVAQRAPGT